MYKKLSVPDLKPGIAIFLFFSLLASASAATTEQPPKKQTLKFDHISTSFNLVGAHELLECEQCHRTGVFKGTPLLCDECHNEHIAFGKPAFHITTNEQCDGCHTTYSTFRTNEVIDHALVSNQPCITCHDTGTISFGKSGTHILSTNSCEACHFTTTFVPAYVIDRAHILGSCPVCHNGVIAPIL